MHKQAPSIEWEIAESDTEWERLQRLVQPDREVAIFRKRFLKRYFWIGVALLLLLSAVGGWDWRTTQSALPPPTTNSSAMVQAKVSEVIPSPAPLVTSILRNEGGVGWWEHEKSDLPGAGQSDEPTTQGDDVLHRIGFQGNQAVVSIITTAENGAPVYRQTRFYRRTPSGWLQTEPDAALWGPERSLETPHFIYHFRQNDAAAVIAVAPKVEALYNILQRNLGLPRAANAEKVVIDVSVTQPPGQADRGFVAPNRLIVPSPAIYLAPVALSDSELLEQSIALPLFDAVLAQAREQHTIGSAWQPLLNGLRLWQIWDLGLPLAAWQAAVVTWIYVDGPAVGLGQTDVLPGGYAELCTTHQLWLPSPARLHIPLLCARAEWEGRFFPFPLWRLRDPLTRLEQLGTPLPPDEYVDEPDYLHRYPHPAQTVALATLVEYAVVTYGREHLPALAAGLGQHESWETLIPAVYGVSVGEFEAGWQLYLAAHYDVAAAHENP